VDKDSDGVLSPLEFRDLFDEIRHPHIHRPGDTTHTKQAKNKQQANARAEDALFLTCLRAADPHQTERITYSAAASVYQRMLKKI
jgi:hypothetical protein